MCEDTAGYSTVVGPRWRIERLIERWRDLRTPQRLRIEQPRIVEFREVDWHSADRFGDDSPALAVAHHPPGLGIPVTAQLQAELMIDPWRHPRSPYDSPEPWGPQLLWEPGYQFQSTHQGDATIPDDPFDAAALDQLVRSVQPVRPWRRARGHRVAVLDTGVRGSGHDMLDFIKCDDSGIRRTPAADPHGHGTAVATAIKAVQGNADIYPIRVLNEKKEGESYEVLAGLMYALWSDQYDLINASLTTELSGRCTTSVGRSIDYTLSYCSVKANLPVLVAAAGNSGMWTPCGYPARLPQAVVALAQDHTGGRAAYNCSPLEEALTEEAYGGSKSHPLGRLPLSPPADTGLWGTSFAAAAVSGAYLP
ncbi:S8/S53 family peptidase [Streptomyces sp. MB09-01]|uniref:S8/S53 family peptidase n=1 Tax=Streptomyces sp. MB09-01 TaxID=3028666 RepID=UPI0029B77045|nr:S8/S53 family peptidase [Streptomyces sp. MB09-01]MDX3535481.1 S8/S53 family peptidase [Streptomyces sp. MB09-01]